MIHFLKASQWDDGYILFIIILIANIIIIIEAIFNETNKNKPPKK